MIVDGSMITQDAAINDKSAVILPQSAVDARQLAT
jgi:hypothetical protein